MNCASISSRYLRTILRAYKSLSISGEHIRISSMSISSAKNLLPVSIFDDLFESKLNGDYILKLVSIRDVSGPPPDKETDFLNIDEEELERDDDSAKSKDKEKKKEIHKGPRCICLILTDGQKEIKAVEYKPIPFLNLDIPEGSRILIKGPTEISAKVLLLTSQNIQVLGS
ncbi:tudor domain containing 3 [Brevipalpus obovatus]|uniref:tudor domain containing 3 n=1 Tax=Brevipalpus obovatus TaxID=246614 RepID=UPI003D9E534D